LQPSLENNLSSVRRRIGDAAARAGRRDADVHLVAVTKSVPVEIATQLAELGQVDLGESRADELERKVDRLARSGVTARWHFVGHLQRNKARRVVERADFIHSVDSLSLLGAIDRLAGELGRQPQLFLQVKMHPEPAKSGFDPSELAEAIDAARDLEHARLRGLMAMAPLGGEIEAARRAFEGLRDLARTSDASAFCEGRAELSMGMSGDFEVAIAAGSDWVRVGTALFEGLFESPTSDGAKLVASDPSTEPRSTVGSPRPLPARKPREGSA
jgi:pyridoxal phosphate enzyme (YggS family)